MSGQNPNALQDETYNREITPEQATADIARLRQNGFAEVATQMESTIAGLGASDLAAQAKQDEILKASHEQLTKLNTQYLDSVKQSESELNQHRRLHEEQARG